MILYLLFLLPVSIRLNYTKSLSLLQAVDPSGSGEGSATRVLFLHSARFLASSTLSCRFSFLCLTTSLHLFLCLPLLRFPPTFASKIRLTQSSSSRRCIYPYHLSLASRILSVIHATPRMRRMSSFLFLSLKVKTIVSKHKQSFTTFKFFINLVRRLSKINFH